MTTKPSTTPPDAGNAAAATEPETTAASLPAVAKPEIGASVLVAVPSAHHSTGKVVPGVVTVVRGEHPEGGHLIAATLFLDSGAPTSADLHLVGDEKTARRMVVDGRGRTAWPARG